MQRLVKAGEELERAQRDAISGGDSGGFQAARREEASAIRRLLDAAEQMLPSASAATLERIEKTLKAAAASAEGRGLVKRGRLVEDLEPPGFEALAGLAELKAPAKGRRAGRGEDKQLQRQLEKLRRRKRDADAESKRTAEEARELERQARDADQIAKKARQAATTARKRADAAAAQSQRLEEELTELQGR